MSMIDCLFGMLIGCLMIYMGNGDPLSVVLGAMLVIVLLVLLPFKSEPSPNVLACTKTKPYDMDSIMGTPKEGKDMTFSDALDKVINFGYRAYRKGWNGKNQFIYYVSKGHYKPCTDVARKYLTGDDGKVAYGAYVAIKTSDGNVVPWTASQTDMLADDWEIEE